MEKIQFGLARSCRFELHALPMCVLTETSLGDLDLIWCAADGSDIKRMKEERLHQEH